MGTSRFEINARLYCREMESPEVSTQAKLFDAHADGGEAFCSAYTAEDLREQLS
jgi:hypothetical protein